MKFAKGLFPFMNLDGGAGGGGGAPVSDPTPQQVSFEAGGQPAGGQPPQLPPNPLLQPDVPPTPTPAETLDFGGRKVPVVDPVLKDLHQDYTQLTSTYQNTNQQNQLLQQQVQFYQQQLQAFQQQQQAPQQQPQAPAEPTPEQIAERNQAFMDKFYENPMEAMREMFEQTLKPTIEQQLAPVQQMQAERQYQQQLQQVAEKYPADFQQMIPHMQKINAENPALVDHLGVEGLYLYARGQQAQAQPQYTPQQMMSDPQFQQQIISNPQIQQQIINQYLQSKQTQVAATPPVMGNNAGGNAPMSPPMQPKTIAEGSKAFREWFSKQ